MGMVRAGRHRDLERTRGRNRRKKTREEKSGDGDMQKERDQRTEAGMENLRGFLA